MQISRRRLNQAQVSALRVFFSLLFSSAAIAQETLIEFMRQKQRVLCQRFHLFV